LFRNVLATSNSSQDYLSITQILSETQLREYKLKLPTYQHPLQIRRHKDIT